MGRVQKYFSIPRKHKQKKNKKKHFNVLIILSHNCQGTYIIKKHIKNQSFYFLLARISRNYLCGHSRSKKKRKGKRRKEKKRKALQSQCQVKTRLWRSFLYQNFTGSKIAYMLFSCHEKCLLCVTSAQLGRRSHSAIYYIRK